MATPQTGGRTRAFLFLGISGITALIASIVILVIIRAYQKDLVAARVPKATAQVIVAAHDLGAGQTIVETDLEILELPEDYVPESALRQAEEAIGRVPRERVLKSEFIREERLAHPEAGLGLNAIVPRGMRALSINISDGSAVSGFLNPGNYVDVLVTLQGEGDREAETNTQLQAVTVLAVNARLGASAESRSGRYKPSVTVAVTPEQAELLTHAITQGDITLTLRNDIDVTQADTHGAVASFLLGGQSSDKRISVKEWVERTQKRKDGTLTIIKGRDATTEKVKGGG